MSDAKNREAAHAAIPARPAWQPPGARLIALVLVLMIVANVFDAWATILILRRGATELNPLMSYALELGPTAFYVTKFCLIGSLSLFLAVASRTRRFAWRALCVLTAIYVAVFAWHLILVLCGPNIAIVLPA